MDVYYLLWLECRDKGDFDTSDSNANFLGEVVLNLSKLKALDGLALEQAFELRKVDFLQSLRI